MKEELYKICDDLLQDEVETKRFLELDTMDDMYGYFSEKLPELTKEELDDFVAELLEKYDDFQSSSQKLSDEDIESVSGGRWNVFQTAAAVALIGCFTVAGAAKSAVQNVASSATSVAQSVKKKTISANKALSNKISRTYKKTKKWVDDHPVEVGAGVAATVGAVTAAAALGATLRAQNNEAKNRSTGYDPYDIEYIKERYRSKGHANNNYSSKNDYELFSNYNVKKRGRSSSSESSRVSSSATDTSKGFSSSKSSQTSKKDAKTLSGSSTYIQSGTKEDMKSPQSSASARTEAGKVSVRSVISEQARIKNEQGASRASYSSSLGSGKSTASTDYQSERRKTSAYSGRYGVQYKSPSERTTYENQKLSSRDRSAALEEMKMIEKYAQKKSKVGAMVDYESWGEVSRGLSNLKRILRHKDQDFLREFKDWKNSLKSKGLSMSDGQREELNKAFTVIESSLEE